MALQITRNMFGAERAHRYKAAMDRCPAARYLEIFPLLCFTAETGLVNSDVVDMGSGTGYLANFFEGHARSVLRVDKSPEMLAASGSPNTITSDMCQASKVIGKECADLITCLASFHHVHVPEIPDITVEYSYEGTRIWGPERYLDVYASMQLQYDAIRDWCRILRPRGRIFLVDVSGIPDPAWKSFWPQSQRHQVNTRAYYKNLYKSLESHPLKIEMSILQSMLNGPWRDFIKSDPHIQAIFKLLHGQPRSFIDLLHSYAIPDDVLKVSGPMVPMDFFDDVLDGYGTQRHFGFFPRETSIVEAMTSVGMTNVWSSTVPTPWFFHDRREAAWFVHELFGLGSAWDYDTIPSKELATLDQWLDQYLGFYTDNYGRTMLYWQLGYFSASKPATNKGELHG